MRFRVRATEFMTGELTRKFQGKKLCLDDKKNGLAEKIDAVTFEYEEATGRCSLRFTLVDGSVRIFSPTEFVDIRP
jgi:hypothetical protein